MFSNPPFISFIITLGSIFLLVFYFRNSLSRPEKSVLIPGRNLYIQTPDFLKPLIRQAYEDWEAFKLQHSKIFINKSHESDHMITFLEIQERIRSHNKAFENGHASFKRGLNHLADLPFSEYQKLNGYRQELLGATRIKNLTKPQWISPLNAAIPDAIDWRDHGFVTPVKDQGDSCGSCWSFSATGALEGQHKRVSGSLVSLSEQNLIDCSEAYGNAGCNGGFPDFAFEYVKDNHGIDTEESYPYKAQSGICRFKNSTIGSEDYGFQDLPPADEEALKIAVATIGPISVGIDADHESFQTYQEGIFFEPKCSSLRINHAVLVIGYGTDVKHGDFWLIKNSWGKGWGEEGYVRMARNKGNHCGIATRASYPLV